MKTKTIFSWMLLISICLFSVLLSSAYAQESSMHSPNSEVESFLDINPASADNLEIQYGAPAATQQLDSGGPDDFGYIWDDTQPINWVDAASTGTDTGLSGNAYPQVTLSLPFAFDFYEQTFTEINVSRFGYVSFIDFVSPYPLTIPDQQNPNGLISAGAMYFELAETTGANRVYSVAGGTAPNRYFAIEWHQIENGFSTYTFEIVLHENGDIDIQYLNTQHLDNGYYCGAVGIEGLRGLDGLLAADCPYPPDLNNFRVHFSRPAAAARVQIYPETGGYLIPIGGFGDFPIKVINRGDYVNDVFDVNINSEWDATAYRADGSTPLVDTNNNGLPDTGALARGAETEVVVKINSPLTSSVGDFSETTVTITSSQDSIQGAFAKIHSAIPADFAYAYQIHANETTYNSVDSLSPQIALNSDYLFGIAALAGTPVVTTLDDQNITIWNANRDNNQELIYIVTDRGGDTIVPITQITDYSPLNNVSTYHYAYSVAATENGKIGIAARQYQDSDISNDIRWRVMLNIVDTEGGVVADPIVVLADQFDNSPGEIPFNLKITATKDNHFVLTWIESSPTNNPDVYFAIYDELGTPIKARTQLTMNPDDNSEYYSVANMVLLKSGDVMIAMRHLVVVPTYKVTFDYVLLDSLGAIVEPNQEIDVNLGKFDLLQLQNGDVMVAGAWYDTEFDVGHMTLEPYSGIHSSVEAVTNIEDADMRVGAAVNLAQDSNGNIVIHWLNGANGRKRFENYALLNKLGEIVTPPMTINHSEDGVYSAFGGNAIASYESQNRTLFLPILGQP